MNSYEYKSIAKRTVIFTTFLLMHKQIKTRNAFGKQYMYIYAVMCVCMRAVTTVS